MIKITIPRSPSVNRQKTFDAGVCVPDLHGDIRVEIIVYKLIKTGDIDNYIMPTLNALKLPLNRIVKITARFVKSKNEKTIVKVCEDSDDRAKSKKGAASRW